MASRARSSSSSAATVDRLCRRAQGAHPRKRPATVDPRLDVASSQSRARTADDAFVARGLGSRDVGRIRRVHLMNPRTDSQPGALGQNNFMLDKARYVNRH